jgi:hypothetical protein
MEDLDVDGIITLYTSYRNNVCDYGLHSTVLGQSPVADCYEHGNEHFLLQNGMLISCPAELPGENSGPRI